MNLPNAITVARIAAAPLIAWLPFSATSGSRSAAFVLFLAAAITDYYDGMLARSRNLVTDLGRMLDPLADKLLLFATFIPMYFLMTPPGAAFPFVTPWGRVSIPLWVLGIVLGRELFMTIFRQLAAMRGVVIGANFAGKLKTVFHFIWIGAAYFWFFANTLASEQRWDQHGAWHAAAIFIGLVGVVSMVVAVALTVYSLLVYLRRYGRVVIGVR